MMDEMARIGGVYPRVCGGTLSSILVRMGTGGLSPRVRGNLQLQYDEPPECRSIPACAGEPPMPSRSGYPAQVYPRVCGGTQQIRAMLIREGGLSPRVRGNPPKTYDMMQEAWSIPACAGEP